MRGAGIWQGNFEDGRLYVDRTAVVSDQLRGLAQFLRFHLLQSSPTSRAFSVMRGRYGALMMAYAERRQPR